MEETSSGKGRNLTALLKDLTNIMCTSKVSRDDGMKIDCRDGLKFKIEEIEKTSVNDENSGCRLITMEETVETAVVMEMTTATVEEEMVETDHTMEVVEEMTMLLIQTST